MFYILFCVVFYLNCRWKMCSNAIVWSCPLQTSAVNASHFPDSHSPHSSIIQYMLTINDLKWTQRMHTWDVCWRQMSGDALWTIDKWHETHKYLEFTVKMDDTVKMLSKQSCWWQMIRHLSGSTDPLLRFSDGGLFCDMTKVKWPFLSLFSPVDW